MTDETNDDDYVERLIDREQLRAYLKERLGTVDRFDVERLPAGHSNETLVVMWGEHELVVRRPPPGETADTAHNVLREYHVVDALQETDVPVPPTVLQCDDPSVIGSDFYVMEKLSGDVLRRTEPKRFAAPESRRQIGAQLVDTLVEIHAVDYEAVGLEDFGRPAGYTERQVERWQKQLDWAFERTAERRRIPALREIGEWLASNVPKSHEHRLVHGDYKLDNVMFGPETPPEIVGVFDWELSTLGDPLADLGWMLTFWYDASDPDPAVPELMDSFMASEGYPTRRELVDRYERRTGIEFDHHRFYRALGVYKLAALGEMFFRRYLEGNSNDPLYPVMETGVPTLADHARQIINGEFPI